MNQNLIIDAIVVIMLIAFVIYFHTVMMPSLKKINESLKRERAALDKEVNDNRCNINNSILFKSKLSLGENAQDRYLQYIATIKEIEADEWLKQREINAAKFMLSFNHILINKD